MVAVLGLVDGNHAVPVLTDAGGHGLLDIGTAHLFAKHQGYRYGLRQGTLPTSGASGAPNHSPNSPPKPDTLPAAAGTRSRRPLRIRI